MKTITQCGMKNSARARGTVCVVQLIDTLYYSKEFATATLLFLNYSIEIAGTVVDS